MEDPTLKSEDDTGSAEEIGGTSSLRKITATSDAVCTVQIRPKPKYDPERRAQLVALYAQINEDLARERDLRLQVEELIRLGKNVRQVSTSLSAGPVSEVDPEAQLDLVRHRVYQTLDQRVALVKLEIEWIEESLGHHLANTLKDTGREELLRQLDARSKELTEHQTRLASLSRWRKRQEIDSLSEEMQTAKGARKAELEKKVRTLAKSLTASAQRYGQSDKRWGKRRYGNSSQCSTIGQGGCGPASLAEVLSFLWTEDPERAESGGDQLTTPDQTAAWAASHGRNCGPDGGTSGTIMFRDVPSQWPNMDSNSITAPEVVPVLNAGNLVTFLCKKCKVKDTKGAEHTFGGHFMVLTGVDQSGTTFDILDSSLFKGVTLSLGEFQKHVVGFWLVKPRRF
jgi:hypothetical protein